MRLAVLIIALTATAALADPIRDAARPCRVERLDRAYVACVEHLAAQRVAAMEARIGHVLSGLQAAYQPELTALEKRYADAQQTWRRAVGAGCARSFPQNRRARADCQLAAALKREDQLVSSLGRAADDLGGALALDIPVPDAVEVLVPLPGAPNGPGHVVRVPLAVPVTGQ